MEVSNGVDINHPWFIGRMIASAGSEVCFEAGSTIVIDNYFDWSHGGPHLNLKIRCGESGCEPIGKNVSFLLEDEHYVDLS